MSTSDTGRQFIMIRFRELDSPQFRRLARSPEFSTYLTLRRYIWRSPTRHSRNLQQWYLRGYLCCGLSRKTIAQRTGGGITQRSVSKDIARLVQWGVVEVAGLREQRVFVLGRWEERDGRVVEHYYLERLRERVESKERRVESQEQWTRGGDACSTGDDARGTTPGGISFPTLWQETSPINRELLNKELRSRVDAPHSQSDAQIWKAVLEELRLQLVRSTFDTWVRPSTAQRVDGHWEITCANALARDWMEGRLATIIRRELAVAAGEGGGGEVVFRAKASRQQ